jgi:hypothetical protein
MAVISWMEMNYTNYPTNIQTYLCRGYWSHLEMHLPPPLRILNTICLIQSIWISKKAYGYKWTWEILRDFFCLISDIFRFCSSLQSLCFIYICFAISFFSYKLFWSYILHFWVNCNISLSRPAFPILLTCNYY